MRRSALLAGAAVTFAGGFAGTTPASARPAVPASPQKVDRLAACYLWSAVTVTAGAPYRSGANVKGEGTWEQKPIYCPHPTGKASGQTKVCGSWGCSWETRGHTGDITLSSSPISRTATQPCRNGTHRYRTRVYYTAVSLDFYGSTPILVSSTSSVDDNKQPEFTC